MEKEKPKDDLDAVRTIVEALEAFDREQRERIIRWATEKLGMRGTATSAAPYHTSFADPLRSTSPSERSVPTTDLKTFIDDKKPKNEPHFAAAVAYYYLHEAPQDRKKESINKKDLSEALRTVQWRQGLKNPGQTLINTYNAGYLDKTKVRGEYRLNMVGQNLVAVILPDDGTSPQTSKPRLQTRKKTAASKQKPGSNKAQRKSTPARKTRDKK